MSKRLNISFVILIIAVLVTSTASSQGVLNKILDNGPNNKRINIVFLGDGYTSTQQSQFDTNATSFLNYLFTIEPFDNYENYYNAYTIFIESNASGVDHPATGIYKDTYFNGTFDSYGITRLTTIPPNNFDGSYSNGMGKVMDLLAAHLPDYDMVILLFNDPEYGGSGGSISISSVHSSAPEIVAHEVGHSFGNLADEYDYAGGSAREAPNATAQTDRELIRWNHWILPSTPVPTPETSPYYNLIGLFEGAVYNPTGWYRPKYNCKMQSLGVPFCSVCSEQLIISEYSYLSPLESYSPVNSVVTVPTNSSQIFEIVPMYPALNALDIQWYLDSAPLSGENSETLAMSLNEVNWGNHTISVEVSDNTSLVLNDPSNLLMDSFSWDAYFEAADSDEDGFTDDIDNCPEVPNPDQENADFDTLGDLCDPYCCAIAGDANDDSNVDILDVVYLITYKYKSGVEPNCFYEGDANTDESIDILDIVYLISFKYKGGPQPACL